MRIAFFTPLNPSRSGIADYSEELLPWLAADGAEIDLVADPSSEPATPAITSRFGMLTPAEFLHRKGVYDSVIYQIGNNYRAHGYMLPCLREAPGIVVLHDYSLTYLMLPVTAERGDDRSLRAILGPAGGVRRLVLGLADPYEVSLARPVVEMSRGVIVHNRHSFNKLAREFPGKPVRMIPHATPMREPRASRDALRREYGLSPDDLVLASISSIAYNKRLQLVLEAVHRLRARRPNLRFLMVGQGEIGSAGRALIRRYGLERHILQTGWVSSEAYLDYIDLADVIIDLRYPTAGETSGSSLRALQAGKPLLVSAEGFFLELPDESCIRLPIGSGELEALVAAAGALLGDPELRRRMGQAGREYARRHLRLEQAASSYLEFAREVATLPSSTVRAWQFASAADTSLRGRLVAAAYRAGRLAYYYRRYGLQGTWNRVAGEAMRSLHRV